MAEPTPPAPPANVRATPSLAEIDLAWDAVPGATAYEVWSSSELAGKYILIARPQGQASRVTGLGSEDTGFFKVRTLRGAIASADSPVVVATTALEGLRAAASGNSITLTWYSFGPTPLFDVEVADAAGGPWRQVAQAVSQTWTEGGLRDAATRFYRLRPSSGGAASNVASATTRPLPPSGVSVAAQPDGAVLLQWQPAAGATSYEVAIATVPGGATWFRPVGNSPQRFGPATLGGGTMRVFFRLRSANDAGTSAATEEREVVLRPLSAFLTPGIGKVTVSWEVPQPVDVVVSRAPAGAPPAPVASVPAGTLSSYTQAWVDEAAPVWTRVAYGVQASDSGLLGAPAVGTAYALGAPDAQNPGTGGCTANTLKLDATHDVGQTFTVTGAGQIVGVEVALYSDVGYPPITLQLLDGAGRALGSAPVRWLFGCAQGLDPVWVGASFADFSAAPIAVTAGEQLRLMLRQGPVAGYVSAKVGSTGDGYAGGTSIHDGAADPQLDLLFRVFVAPAGAQ